MRRPARITVGVRDWNGDAVLTIVAGVALLVCLFLPWANERVRGVNWSVTKPGDIGGAIHTPWGGPMLVISLLVMTCGVLMLVLGPRRLAFLLGVVVFVSGLLAGKLAADGAWHALGWDYSAGIGVAGSLFVAVLLLPIGFASAAVGFMVAYWAPQQSAAAAAVEPALAAAVVTGDEAPEATAPPAP